VTLRTSSRGRPCVARCRTRRLTGLASPRVRAGGRSLGCGAPRTRVLRSVSEHDREQRGVAPAALRPVGRRALVVVRVRRPGDRLSVITDAVTVSRELGMSPSCSPFCFFALAKRLSATSATASQRPLGPGRLGARWAALSRRSATDGCPPHRFAPARTRWPGKGMLFQVMFSNVKDRPEGRFSVRRHRCRRSRIPSGNRRAR
jgi:hypothetical protein